MKYNVFVSPCLKDKVFSSYEILKFIKGKAIINTIKYNYVFCNEKETYAFLQYEDEDVQKYKFSFKAIVHDNYIKKERLAKLPSKHEKRL